MHSNERRTCNIHDRIIFAKCKSSKMNVPLFVCTFQLRARESNWMGCVNKCIFNENQCANEPLLPLLLINTKVGFICFAISSMEAIALSLSQYLACVLVHNWWNEELNASAAYPWDHEEHTMQLWMASMFAWPSVMTANRTEFPHIRSHRRKKIGKYDDEYGRENQGIKFNYHFSKIRWLPMSFDALVRHYGMRQTSMNANCKWYWWIIICTLIEITP